MEDTEDRNESQKKEKKLKGTLYKEGKRQRGGTEWQRENTVKNEKERRQTVVGKRETKI
jgi:hypothetical protein